MYAPFGRVSKSREANRKSGKMLLFVRMVEKQRGVFIQLKKGFGIEGREVGKKAVTISTRPSANATYHSFAKIRHLQSCKKTSIIIQWRLKLFCLFYLCLQQRSILITCCCLGLRATSLQARLILGAHCIGDWLKK